MVDWQATGEWFIEHGIRIAIILALALTTYVLGKKAIPAAVRRTLARTMKDQPEVEIEKRSNTLGQLLRTMVSTILVIVAVFLILNEIGINIAALLAGFGVAGIAVGFGAQSLIKDLIGGFIVELENQYNVGDVVKIAGITGIVDSFTMRRTTLRDLDGILHFVPNGETGVASNYTRAWSRAHLEIPVAYKEDVDQVMATIRQVWEEVAEDPKWGPQLISKTPWLLRVNSFEDRGIIVKVVGETQPMKQWDLMGELRRKIKKAFDEQGIEIPWNYSKVYLGDDVRTLLEKASTRQ